MASVGPLPYIPPFSFFTLIHRKEVFQFLKDMLRQFVHAGVTHIRWVAIGNRNDFFIAHSAIFHRHDPNRITPNQCHRLNRSRTENQHVQRVVVVAVCSGNKAVIHGIIRCSEQHSVQRQHTGFLVQFIFHVAALGDFYHCGKICWINAFWFNIVPNIHEGFLLLSDSYKFSSKKV